MPQIEIAKPDALAVAGAVDNQAGDAARDQVGDALEILNFLCDIEAVEEHHGRHLAAAVGRFGMHIDCRQAGVAIGNFDVLQARPLDVFRRVAQGLHATHIGVVAFLALGLQKALAHMIIGAGALEILRAAHRMAFGDAFAAAVLDDARLERPFTKPGIIVADAFLEPQPDAINLAYLRAAPGRHVQPYQQTVRPAVIFRKIRERQFFLCSHKPNLCRSSRLCPAGIWFPA